MAPSDDVEHPKKVVTFLEMLAPPADFGRPEAPSASVSVVLARNPTVDYYRFLYDAVGRVWAWTDRKRLSDAALAAIIEDPRVELHVLFDDGVPIGYAELDARTAPDIELAYFGIVPERLHRRLGPFLLRWIVAHAWEKQPKRLWLNTCSVDHPRALPLYERVGFVPYRREERLVEDPEAVIRSAPLREALLASRRG